MNARTFLFRLVFISSVFILFPAALFAQSTGFLYQGYFKSANAPATGQYDFQFKLFDAASSGTQQGPTILLNSVTVTNGSFAVDLDFGVGPFSGSDRYLEIAVQPSGGPGLTTLAPRELLSPAPYAIRSRSSATADLAQNSTQLGGVSSTQFVLTNDSRLSDARPPAPGSPSYIQNSTSQQSSSNFNVSGNGTVAGTLTGGTVSASTQFNLGLNRLIGKVGANNLFIGTLAGSANGGIQNTLVGDSAGRDVTGNENSLFGFVAGQQTTSGINNAFFGSRAGMSNLSGSNNTMIGAYSALGANDLSNAGALGYRSFVESNNSLVLGGINGKNGATADTSVGIGTSTPFGTLDVEGQLPFTSGSEGVTPNLRLTNFGRYASIKGRASRGTRTSPIASFTNDPLFVITAEGYNGSNFSTAGQATIFFSATENWTSTANGTAINFNTTPNGSVTEALRMIINQDGNVGIGIDSNPARRLDVNGIIRVGSTTGTIGCVEDRDGTVIAGTCSSDIRFKKNITPFGTLLDNFSKLRPVNYFWRADEFKDQHFGDRRSYGLIAQEVEELFPDLVTTDEKGYKAVNYSKLPLLTIQAVKELKAENDSLKQQVDDQKKAFDKLRSDLRALQLLVRRTGTIPPVRRHAAK